MQERISKVSISETGEYVLVPIELWNSLSEKLAVNLDTANHVGDLIRHYRNLNNMTKKELAEKAILAPCQISNFEKRKKAPRIETIKKLSLVFGNTFYMEAIAIRRSEKK